MIPIKLKFLTENHCLIAGRGAFVVAGADPHEKRTEDKLGKATKDACKTTIEVIHGLMAQMIKDRLFNSVCGRQAAPTPMIE